MDIIYCIMCLLVKFGDLCWFFVLEMTVTRRLLMGKEGINVISIGTHVFVKIFHSCNVCGSYYGCCCLMHISFSLSCVLK